MIKLNLSRYSPVQLQKFLNQYWDQSGNKIPIILVKISNAFSMYHQISTHDYYLTNQRLAKFHPILINDLDTNFTVLMLNNQSGKIMGYQFLAKNLKLSQRFPAKIAPGKQANQEYLDYFFCLTKNLEANLKDKK